MAPTYEFDEAIHQYKLDGKIVPSVTKVLDTIDPDLRFNQRFIEKTLIGTRVHGICDRINRGEHVDVESLQEPDKFYVQAWVSYLEESRFQVESSEKRVFSRKFGYAGTMDVKGRTHSGLLAYLDIKTTSLMPITVGLQLAGYCAADMEMDGIVGCKPHRICVQLLPDGTYAVKQMKSDTYDYDLYIFLCKLKSYQWDMENNNNK